MFNPFRRPVPAPPPAPAPEAPETTWQVEATLAGVTASRNLQRLFGFTGMSYPDNLLVDNTRCATGLTLTVNGRTRRVAAGGTVEVRQREVGNIESYTITPIEDIDSDDVRVYERRIGNGGVP